MAKNKAKVMDALKHIEKQADNAEVRSAWKNVEGGNVQVYYEFWVTKERGES